jgi:hypothetical protein
MLQLAFSSRRQSTGKRSWSSYSIGLFAIAYAVMFWIAGVFSNKAISVSSAEGMSAVIVRNKHCGTLNETYALIANDVGFTDEDEYDQFVELKGKKEHDTQLSLEYAQACYLHDAPTKYLPSICNTMKKSSLNWTVGVDSCPFQSQICHNQSEVIVLDTGKIDSHKDLGINAPSKNRLSYQRVTRCAVLDDSNYITGWDGAIVNSSSPKPPPDTAFANFGRSLYKGTNYTYSYSNFASFYDRFTSQVTLPYQLEPELAYAPADPQWSLSDFEPVPEISQNNADLVLLFLGFNGGYLGPIDDPWFSSHQEQQHLNLNPFLQSWFYRDKAISTIGCTTQHQFCTSNETCTGFGGFDQIQNNASFNAALSPRQNVTFNRMLEAVSFSELKFVVENFQRTITPLLASNVTMEGTSGAILSSKLPDDQWTTEVNFWHSVCMAQLQRTIVQWATGQNAAQSQYLVPAQGGPDKWFCENMIVPSIVFQSFSVAAIVLIIFFGSLIVSISLTIDDIAAFIRKKLRNSPPRRGWDHFHMLRTQTPLRTRFRPEEVWRHTSSPRDAGADENVELEEAVAMANIHRISSPTLPPEDRGLSISTFQQNFSRPRCHIPPDRPPRPARDSWMAISLNNFDLEATETSQRTTEYHRPRRAPLAIIPPPLVARPFAQRWRPYSPGYSESWV